MILQSFLILIGTAYATTPILPSPATEFSGKMEGKELMITLTPPPHYHFNLKAPFSLQRKRNDKKLKALQVNEHKIQFKVPAPQSEDFEAQIFLCDDSKKWCEKQAKNLHWNSENSVLTIQNG